MTVAHALPVQPTSQAHAARQSTAWHVVSPQVIAQSLTSLGTLWVAIGDAEAHGEGEADWLQSTSAS